MSTMTNKEMINFPVWLENSISDIFGTEEWASYAYELNHVVGKVLHRTNVRKVEQLTSEALEHIILIESKCLTGSKSHSVLLKKLRQLLAKHLTREVEQRMVCYQPLMALPGQVRPDVVASWTSRLVNGPQLPPETVPRMSSLVFPSRADLLTVEAQEAIVALLSKHPKFCQKLAVRLCNYPLQGSYFRRKIWQIGLSNKRVRDLYVNLLRTDVSKTRSICDEAILCRCQKYLEQEDTVKSMRSSIGCLHALKTIVSFFHLASNITDNVKDSLLCIAGTLVLSMSDYLPRGQPPHLEDAVTLIEELFSLMSQLPSYITKQPSLYLRRYRPSGTYKRAEVHTSHDEAKLGSNFGTYVLQQLRLMDAQVATEILQEILTNRGTDVSLDATRQDEICGPIVFEVVSPILEPLFAGFLQPDVLLFVWDQILFCLVGSAPITRSLEYLLSAILAIILHLVWLRQSHKNNQMDQQEDVRTIGTNTETDNYSEQTHRCTELDGNCSTNKTTVDTQLSHNNCSWLENIKQLGLQLVLEDIRFLFKKHFFGGFYCLLSDLETAGSATGESSLIAAQINWEEWFSLLDQPASTVIQSRQSQRVLRFIELKKLQNLETTENETKQTCQALRDQLRLVQEDSDQMRERLKNAKLETKQLREENRSWATVVENLEKKIDQMESASDSYVTESRKLKLAQYLLSHVKEDDNKKSANPEPNDTGDKKSQPNPPAQKATGGQI